MDAPDIKTTAARPEGEGDHRSRRAVRVAVLHARLSARHRPRRRRGRRGRGRQPLPRLRRRHRRQLDRRTRIPTSSRRSASRRRSSSTCRAPTSTTSRRCGSPRSWRRIVPIDGDVRTLLRQLRHRSDRSGDQAGALSHEAARASSRSSARSTAARSGSLALTASKVDAAPRLRAAACPASITRRIRIPIAFNGSAGRVRRASLVVHRAIRSSCTSIVARRSRGDRRRADPGRRRLHRAADERSCRGCAS